MAEGLKYDADKLRFDLIAVEPLEEVAAIYTMGAKKYADNNWRKGLKWGRVFGAIMRHLWAWWRGQDLDPESGRSHLAHAAWGCLTLMEYTKTHPELDDRVKPEASPGGSKPDGKCPRCGGVAGSHTYVATVSDPMGHPCPLGGQINVPSLPNYTRIPSNTYEVTGPYTDRPL